MVPAVSRAPPDRKAPMWRMQPCMSAQMRTSRLANRHTVAYRCAAPRRSSAPRRTRSCSGCRRTQRGCGALGPLGRDRYRARLSPRLQCLALGKFDPRSNPGRPQIDSSLTANRSDIDPRLTPDRLSIDTRRPHIDSESISDRSQIAPSPTSKRPESDPISTEVMGRGDIFGDRCRVEGRAKEGADERPPPPRLSPLLGLGYVCGQTTDRRREFAIAADGRHAPRRCEA